MKGKIIQVMGPVVDVEFDGYLPEINEAIDVSGIASGKDRLVLEVAAHIGDGRVRAIAMDMTDGLIRGQECIATGGPIKVPVGEAVLGRIFNVIGDPVDEGAPIPQMLKDGLFIDLLLLLKSNQQKQRCLKQVSKLLTF